MKRDGHSNQSFGPRAQRHEDSNFGAAGRNSPHAPHARIYSNNATTWHDCKLFGKHAQWLVVPDICIQRKTKNKKLKQKTRNAPGEYVNLARPLLHSLDGPSAKSA